jgi:hypothetical protein
MEASGPKTSGRLPLENHASYSESGIGAADWRTVSRSTTEAHVKPSLDQATEARLSEIRDVLRSGAGELAGKSMREMGETPDDSGKIIKRFRGFSHAYPELVKYSYPRQTLLRALDTKKGKVYELIYRASRDVMEYEGFVPRKKRSPGKSTVEPHAGRSRCTHCGVMHTKGQHRFHGADAFHRTHAFAFGDTMSNPEWRIPAGWEHEYERYDRMTVAQLKREYLDLTKGSFDKVFGHNARNARRIVGRILRERGYYWIDNQPFGEIPIKENTPMFSKRFKPGDRIRYKPDKSLGTVADLAGPTHLLVRWDDGERSQVSTSQVVHSMIRKNPGKGRGFYFFGSFTSKLAAKRKEAKIPGSFIREIKGRYYVMKPRKTTLRRVANPPQRKKLVRIYGRVVRVIAKKTGAHRNCDAECKRCHHEYFHDFKSGAVMYGQPDGTILIKKG